MTRQRFPIQDFVPVCATIKLIYLNGFIFPNKIKCTQGIFMMNLESKCLTHTPYYTVCGLFLCFWGKLSLGGRAGWLVASSIPLV